MEKQFVQSVPHGVSERRAIDNTNNLKKNNPKTAGFKTVGWTFWVLFLFASNRREIVFRFAQGSNVKLTKTVAQFQSKSNQNQLSFRK